MQWSELISFYCGGKSQAFVLATLVKKEGSSYRQPGARLLVRADGAIAGSLSAGCLEEEIARAAMPVMRTGRARLLTIDTRPHYGCPGRITVLLEALRPANADRLFSGVAAALRSRQGCTVVTDYRDIHQAAPLTTVSAGRGDDEATIGESPDILVQSIGRQPRLVVVGQGEDARALAKMALLAKWDVQSVEVTDVQFAPAKLVTLFPPDDRTALVLMSHNLGHDAACLQVVLRQPYSYLGVIGSARRRNELIRALESAGDMPGLDGLENLFCPAGLDLGADEAAEIALSILAEIQCVWSGRDAVSLRERVCPIHQ